MDNGLAIQKVDLKTKQGVLKRFSQEGIFHINVVVKEDMDPEECIVNNMLNGMKKGAKMPSVKMSKVKVMHEKLCEEYGLSIGLVFTDGLVGAIAEGYMRKDPTTGKPVEIGISKTGKRKAGTLMHEWAHILELKEKGESPDNPTTMWHEKKKVELMKKFNIKGLYLRYPNLEYFTGFTPAYPYQGHGDEATN